MAVLGLQSIVVECKIVRGQLTQSPDIGPIHITEVNQTNWNN